MRGHGPRRCPRRPPGRGPVSGGRCTVFGRWLAGWGDGVWRALGVAFALAVTAAPVWAAEVTVSASVAPDEVTVGEAVTYTVSVSGDAGSVTEPELPDLDGFRAAGSGSSTFFTAVNGQVTRRHDFTYTLVPERDGRLTVGPATVRVGGKAYRTGPVTVNVLPAGSSSRAQPAPPSAQGQPGFPRIPGFPQLPGFPGLPGFNAPALQPGDVKVSLSADRDDPYVGEQVVLTFRLDRAVTFAVPADYTPPPTPGFRAVDVEMPPGAGHSVRIENGRRWVTEERRMILFPLQAGDATVGPAGLSFTVDPFAGGQHLVTDPVPLHVRPLPPAGRPPGFAGAVGSFALKAEADRTRAKAGDAVTLTVRLSGSGNFRDIPKVDLKAPDAVEVYDPELEDHLANRPEGVRGERVFKYVLVPKRAGDLEIGPARLAVFDPDTGRYETLEAGPVALTVAPAAPGAPAAGATPSPAAAPEGAEKAAPSRREALGAAAAAFAAGIVLLLLRRLRRGGAHAPAPPEAERPAPAPDPGAARRALEAALAAPAGAAFARDTERALRAWLGARWQVPATRVDADAVRRHLRSAPEADQEACAAALEALQAARYAPGGAGLERDPLAETVRRAVAAVEAAPAEGAVTAGSGTGSE